MYGKAAANHVATAEFYAHALLNYSDSEFLETMRVASSAAVVLRGDSSSMRAQKSLPRFLYKEVQVHGDVELSRDVGKIVVHEKHRNTEHGARLAELCAQRGMRFSFMDEERVFGGQWNAQGAATPWSFFSPANHITAQYLQDIRVSAKLAHIKQRTVAPL